MDEQKIVEKYFEVSNQSNFEEIKNLFNENITYSSQNTGLYVGISSILEMQKSFHNSFENLNWKILNISREKEHIYLVEFEFIGEKEDETIQFIGDEYVIVLDNKIQHIEIRNK